MNISPKLPKGGYVGHYIGTTIGVLKGDTISFDSSCLEQWDSNTGPKNIVILTVGTTEKVPLIHP